MSKSCKIRNPLTGRCVLRTDAIGKKLRQAQSSKNLPTKLPSVLVKLISEMIHNFLPKKKGSGGLITDLSAIVDPLYCYGAYVTTPVKPTQQIQLKLKKALWFEYDVLCDVKFVKYDGEPLVYAKKKDQKIIDESKVQHKVYLYNLVYDPINIYRGDRCYIGEIPENVSVQELYQMLAKGLKKYMYIYAFVDQRSLQSFTENELVGVLDGWFERDGRKENFFDHLVDNSTLENGFLEKVAKKAINMWTSPTLLVDPDATFSIDDLVV